MPVYGSGVWECRQQETGNWKFWRVEAVGVGVLPVLGSTRKKVGAILCIGVTGKRVWLDWHFSDSILILLFSLLFPNRLSNLFSPHSDVFLQIESLIVSIVFRRSFLPRVDIAIRCCSVGVLCIQFCSSSWCSAFPFVVFFFVFSFTERSSSLSSPSSSHGLLLRTVFYFVFSVLRLLLRLRLWSSPQFPPLLFMFKFFFLLCFLSLPLFSLLFLLLLLLAQFPLRLTDSSASVSSRSSSCFISAFFFFSVFGHPSYLLLRHLLASFHFFF